MIFDGYMTRPDFLSGLAKSRGGTYANGTCHKKISLSLHHF